MFVNYWHMYVCTCKHMYVYCICKYFCTVHMHVSKYACNLVTYVHNVAQNYTLM